MKSPALRGAGTAHLLPIDMKEATLPLYLPLWYPYSDMDGSTIYSYDKNHHSCGVTGAVWGTTGRYFTTDDLINLDNVVSSISSATAGTISFWLSMPDATPAANMFPIAFADTDALEVIYIYVSTNGTVLSDCYVAGAAKWSLASPAGIMMDNTFSLITLVQDGTSPVLYQNTGAVDETADGADTTVWFADMTGMDNGRIGCRSQEGNGNANFLTGTVGEVFVFNRALSAGEIANLYDKTKWRYI